jgi:hypothetical protein
LAGSVLVVDDGLLVGLVGLVDWVVDVRGDLLRNQKRGALGVKPDAFALRRPTIGSVKIGSVNLIMVM